MDLRRLLLAGLGSGFAPHAPGTVGSLAAGLVLGAAWLLGGRWGLGVGAIAMAACASLAVLAWTDGATRGGTHDPGWIVADEWAGQAVAMLGLLAAPPRSAAGEATLLGAAFVLFRAFDVWKPGPIGAAGRKAGGLGVLLDDLLAGLVAAAGVAALGTLLR